MFTRKKTNPKFEELIERQLDSLKYDIDADDFDRHLDQLERLQAASTTNRRPPVSSDTLAMVFGNLAGIAIITWHERDNILTSKAINFVRKLW